MLYSIFIYFTTMLVMLAVASIFSTTGENIRITRTENIGMVGVLALIFAVIFGMRWDVGVDNLAYLFSYRYMDTERYEYGFKFISNYLRKENFHYSIFFGIIAFIQFFLFLLAFKNKRFLWPFLIIALFGCNLFWDWMNTMRQETASCIACYGIKYVVERKPWKYLLTIVIAVGFHKSALLLILLYPIVVSAKNLTPTRWLQWSIMLLPAGLAIKKIDIISKLFPVIDQLQQLSALEDYSVYNGRVLQKFSAITQIGTIFYIFIIVNSIIILYSNKLQKYFNNRYFRIYYNLYYWGMVCEMFFAQNLVLTRPFRYFRIYKIIIVAYTMYYLFHHPSRENNLILSCLIILMLAGLGWVSLQSPFRFFFEIPYAP